MTGEKRVQIKSDFTSEAAYSFERVQDKDTGEINVTKNSNPTISSSTTTITTKPYTVDTNSSSETTQNVGSSSTMNINKPGYDTSQL
jgi:hypothetical protein